MVKGHSHSTRRDSRVFLFTFRPSQSGKSHFCLQLLRERGVLIDKHFDHIIYCWPGGNASEKDTAYHLALKKAVPGLEIVTGLPDWALITSYTGSKCVIIDDLGLEVLSSKQSHDAFCVTSNHHDCSIILCLQNFFTEGKYAKTIVRNCNYQCLFLDKGNRQYLRTLSSRIFPTHSNFLSDAMEWCRTHLTNQFSHYVLVDNSSLSLLPSDMQVRTKIFKDVETGFYEPVFLLPAKK